MLMIDPLKQTLISLGSRHHGLSRRTKCCRSDAKIHLLTLNIANNDHVDDGDKNKALVLSLLRSITRDSTDVKGRGRDHKA